MCVRSMFDRNVDDMESIMAIEQSVLEMVSAEFVCIPKDIVLPWRRGNAKLAMNNVMPDGVASTAYDVTIGDLPRATIVESVMRARAHALNSEVATKVKNVLADLTEKGTADQFDRVAELHKARTEWLKYEKAGLKARKSPDTGVFYDERTTMARLVAFEKCREFDPTFPADMKPANLKKIIDGPTGEKMTVDAALMFLLSDSSPLAPAFWTEADERIEKAKAAPKGNGGLAGMFAAMQSANAETSDETDEGETSDDDESDDDGDEDETSDETPANDPPATTRRGRQLPVK